MRKPNKLIVDLSGEDKLILQRMANHLELPIATIVRWCIRYYALHGPVLKGWSKQNPNLLEGFDSLVVGLGVREGVPQCDDAAQR